MWREQLKKTDRNKWGRGGGAAQAGTARAPDYYGTLGRYLAREKESLDSLIIVCYYFYCNILIIRRRQRNVAKIYRACP